METESDVEVLLCKSNTSVIAFGRDDDACEKAVVSEPTNSMSIVVKKSSKTVVNFSIVSSFLFFV